MLGSLTKNTNICTDMYINTAYHPPYGKKDLVCSICFARVLYMSTCSINMKVCYKIISSRRFQICLFKHSVAPLLSNWTPNMSHLRNLLMDPCGEYCRTHGYNSL